MKYMIVVFAIVLLAGCGVETATTAATGAAIKAKEMEEAKNTQEQIQKKINQAVEQVQQRAHKGGEQ